MHRFFSDSSSVSGERIIICGDDAKHISRVLRLGVQDEIIICDKCGTDYICSIESITSEGVECRIVSESPSATEPSLKLTLYQGVPKGDKLDTVIQKAVELGAVRIVPVAMKRSVAVYKDKSKKRDRQQRIAYEAAKQCDRGIIPVVEEVMNFKDAIADSDGLDLKILPYECEREQGLKSLLKANPDIQSAAIFIGPEGGFDTEEVSLACDAGFNVVGLGPRIMRTETAPIACIAAVMYELGDW